MKNVISLVSIIFLNLFYLNTSILKANDFSVNKIIEYINISLDVNSELEDIEIESAVISLKTSYNKSGGGSFSAIFSGEKSYSNNNINEVIYNFHNEELQKLQSEKSKMFSLKDNNLKKAIINAANNFKLINNITGLEKKNFKVKISFSITKVTGGGFKFEIFGIGGDAEVDFKEETLHSIELSFISKNNK